MTIFSKIINYVCEIFLQAVNTIWNYFFSTDISQRKSSDDFEADILYEKSKEEVSIPNDEPFEILSDSEIETI